MLQKLVFTKGLNSDSSPQEFSLGEGRRRVNVRILNPNNSEKQSAEPVLGNVLMSYVLPVGDNKVIGAYDYKLDRKNYYFVYNSQGYHSILEYNQVTHLVAVVLGVSFLASSPQLAAMNFKVDALITGINVIRIDVGKTLLYWTDGWINHLDPNDFNEPKKINIEKGKLFMLGDYVNGYKFPFNPEILYRIKQPPLHPPTYTWSGGQDFEFKAAGNGVAFHAGVNDSGSSYPDPITGVRLVQYKNVYINTGSDYNPVNSTWTVPVTGSYDIYGQVSSWLTPYSETTGAVGGIGGTTTKYSLAVYIQVVVNGAVVYTNSSVPTFDVKGVNIDAIRTLPLNAGDQVFIQSYLKGTGGSTYYGTSFTSIDHISELDVNNLFKKLPQFKCQFVYDDYEVSSWSPISNYVFPKTIGSSPTGNDIIAQDDTITINVPTGNSIVTSIRIASKNVGDINFVLIGVVDKAKLNLLDDATYQYEFKGGVLGVPLEVNESIKLFDWVPLTSQSQELIEGTRIADGLVSENFNPVSIDMRLKLNTVLQLVNVNDNSFYPAQQYLKSGGEYDYVLIYSDHGGRLGLANITEGKSTVLLPNGKYGTTLAIPFLTESDYPSPHYTTEHATPTGDVAYVPVVNAEIYNEPPVWATHYFIGRSKNKAMNRYIQFISGNLIFSLADGVPLTAPYSSATRIVVNLANITGQYKKENPNSLLVYDFVPGDRIRFIANRRGAGFSSDVTGPLFPFNDSTVVSYDSVTQNIVVLLDSKNDFLRTFDGGLNKWTMFEIYNPASQVVSGEFAYEIGECYDIYTLPNGEKAHLGGQGTADQSYVPFTGDSFNAGSVDFITSVISGFVVGDKIKATSSVFNANNTYATITGIASSGTGEIISTDIPWAANSVSNTGILTKAAIVQLSGGDCFRIYQNLPTVLVVLGVDIIYRLYTYIESANASNMFVSNAWDYGRPNIVDDKIVRIIRPSTVRYSEKFIPETFINGLSSCFDLNFQTYHVPYGGIYKLFYDNQRLSVFQELKIGAVLVNQSIFNNYSIENVVGASAEILPSQMVYYKPLLGIGKHPESFAYYGGAMYGIDVNRSVLWRLSNDGLTEISSIYNMSGYFNSKCMDILTASKKVDILGVFDVNFGEYIVSFDSYVNGNSEVVPGETLAFNEDENLWSTFYSYLPEMMCSDGINIISFKNGSLYRHNTGAVYNNFYGVQYKSSLWFYCNMGPSNVKVFEAMSLEAKNAWDVIIETPVTDENPKGQHTELIQSNFDLKEGVWYSELLKDDNTPNVISPRFNGDPMRGVYAFVKLEYSLNTYTKIFACNMLFIPSDRSNK